MPTPGYSLVTSLGSYLGYPMGILMGALLGNALGTFLGLHWEFSQTSRISFFGTPYGWLLGYCLVASFGEVIFILLV